MEWREEDVVIEEVGGRNLPWAIGMNSIYRFGDYFFNL